MLTTPQSSPVYSANAVDFEHAKITPSSRNSTLRRGGDLLKAYTLVSPLGQSNNHATTAQSAATNGASAMDAYQQLQMQQQQRPDYLNFERHTLDYRLNSKAAPLLPPPPTTAQSNAVGYGLHDSSAANGLTTATLLRSGASNLAPAATATNNNDDYRLSSAAPLAASGVTNTNSNSDFAALRTQTLPTTTMRMASLPSTSQAAASGMNQSRQSRQHIITDTLPGPESCV